VKAAIKNLFMKIPLEFLFRASNVIKIEGEKGKLLKMDFTAIK